MSRFELSILSMNRSNSFFSTVTINNWISIFEDFPNCIDISYDAFSYFAKNNQARIFAFVIMRDHIHLLWQPLADNEINAMVTSFKKYTSRRFLEHLKLHDTTYLEEYFSSNRRDRDYKFWKSNSTNFLIQHKDIFKQKIDYIHNNPIKGDYKVCDHPTDYMHSSAKSYSKKSAEYSFLTLVS